MKQDKFKIDEYFYCPYCGSRLKEERKRQQRCSDKTCGNVLHYADYHYPK